MFFKFIFILYIFVYLNIIANYGHLNDFWGLNKGWIELSWKKENTLMWLKQESQSINLHLSMHKVSAVWSVYEKLLLHLATYWALHGRTPDPLYPCTTSRALRSSTQGFLCVCWTDLKTRGDRSFQSAAHKHLSMLEM